MKLVISLISFIFSLGVSAADYPLIGTMESLTGKFDQGGWNSCEAELYSRTEDAVQLRVRISRKGIRPASFERYLLLDKADLDFLFDIRWDFGASEAPVPVADGSLSTVNSHRVRFENNDNQMVYRLWHIERSEGTPYFTSEIICRFNLK